MTKKKIKKTKTKSSVKAKKNQTGPLTLGNINPDRGRILILIISIILVITGMQMSQAIERNDDTRNIKPIEISKPTPLANEIKKMVQGYPIEKMTPYIVKQDPKTAMFLVAIAKKESAWGKRVPVLDGQDCYNYWGFRLKSERMGSGGHTCFDSPEQAVDTIAQRIDELVEKEKIDNPNKMIVWKCGYECQNRAKSESEKKWIKDVGYYYNELLN
ncbi:MAG: hypothetical protein ACD_9C00212G0002 [uncultured bacterium]|nr:MAG: hypothetical protein ACD_9C00212G0002 [uncultured bacterium]